MSVTFNELAVIQAVQGTEFEHRNHISKNIYTGQLNIEALTAWRKKNNFKSNEWLTFLQANQCNRKIKKGSKGIHISRGFGDVTVPDQDKNDGSLKTITVPLRGATVFNLDQTELKEDK